LAQKVFPAEPKKHVDVAEHTVIFVFCYLYKFCLGICLG
jgi:hypothetical protein